MASAKQIAWRKKFAQKYGKKGSKKKIVKDFGTLEKKMEDRIKAGGKGGTKSELNAIIRAKINATDDPVIKKALKHLMFKS